MIFNECNYLLLTVGCMLGNSCLIENLNNYWPIQQVTRTSLETLHLSNNSSFLFSLSVHNYHPTPCFHNFTVLGNLCSGTSVHEHFYLWKIWFPKRTIWKNFIFVCRLCNGWWVWTWPSVPCEHEHGHLSRIMEHIKLVSWATTVCTWNVFLTLVLAIISWWWHHSKNRQ